MSELVFGDLLPRTAEEHGRLSDRFVIPPFSVLDTRQGEWQSRRRAWLALGIKSELGREVGALDTVVLDAARYQGFTTLASQSIFDPVLCELVYRWFCPAGGSVLDPFAGGSVRGIVAAYLGHPYTGIDLSGPQVRANNEQRHIVPGDRPQPVWHEADSLNMSAAVGEEKFDLVFSCPPYYDLEVYSDHPADLSNLSTYAEFVDLYTRIIRQAADRLRPDRMLVLVVGEVRDKRGYCLGLVPDTVNAARLAGLRLYNEGILVNSLGSLPVRAGAYMEAARKLGRCHQNVLVFAKGDPGRGWSYDRPAPPDPQLALFG